MIICCIGDSLTEGDYGIFGKRGIANVHDENYPYFMARMLGAEVRNFGKCGYKASTFLDNWEQNNVDVSNADIILIMLGANGGMDSCGDSLDNEAYKKIVDKCKKLADKAEIILITTPHVTENPEYSNCGYASRVNEAVKFTRAFAAESKLYCIDLAAFELFNAENEKIMQPNDGLHYSRVGYHAMAEFISRELVKRYPEKLTFSPVALD